MRVNPSGSNPSVDQVRTPGTSARSSEKAGTVEGAAQGDTFARSSDLSRLMESLRQLPDVRDDVLAQVRAKIEAGELANEAALAATATSIVDGQQ